MHHVPGKNVSSHHKTATQLSTSPMMETYGQLKRPKLLLQNIAKKWTIGLLCKSHFPPQKSKSPPFSCRSCRNCLLHVQGNENDIVASKAPCWPWKLERYFTISLLPFRRVFIEESPFLSTISLSFKFLIIQEWLLTIQVRLTVDAIWPVCLKIRILREHKLRKAALKWQIDP